MRVYEYFLSCELYIEFSIEMKFLRLMATTYITHMTHEYSK
ncbi:hypothetical protein DICTH_0443 [Dictyoglomus thermophilum H-6-12]|uniref:Uncharacterized protein n=1 Tax=Dictyoglomus thermophilum (strain ATCC 35947 / DSM 3960 / H-6-12) TaxID=309799 RepID=B5YCR7_DICT6|nr:hypothetical protein DICTH_0443 [Dictyoglomus thermophilum H-6-12]